VSRTSTGGLGGGDGIRISDTAYMAAQTRMYTISLPKNIEQGQFKKLKQQS